MENFYVKAQGALEKVKSDYSAVSSMVDFNTTEGRKIIQFLLKHEFITLRGPLTALTIADITPTGSDAVDEGVYNFVVGREQQARTRSDLEFKKLGLDVKNAERIHGTYWYTFAIAIAGFLLAVYSAFIKH